MHLTGGSIRDRRNGFSAERAISGSPVHSAADPSGLRFPPGHSADQVVIFYRTLFVMNSQITGKIQMFQRRPGKLRIAPVPVHLPRHVQIGGADRSPLPAMIPFTCSLTVSISAWTSVPTGGAGRGSFKIGPVLRGKDGEVFIEVINQHPVLVQKLIASAS